MDKFREVIKDLRVLARSRPLDKYTLVLGLRHEGNIVAVTGDGTNDAQALSRSDVGFSMGIQGTDIAKDASDIILLDDNFASIVTAVMWGRNIFDCIRKFIQFQMTVNICACFLVFLTACIGNETPLTAIQMLWLNLIMDSLGSLALATEPPNDKLLQRAPYPRKEYIINWKMWKHILFQAFIELGILLFLYLYAPMFIREDEPYRIGEINVIMNCYGAVPGRSPDADGYYIINGSSQGWSESINLRTGMTVADCGKYINASDLSKAFKTYENAYGSTAHMTIVFNTFVLYTLFNQLSARIIDDNLNTFYEIHKNWLFIVIMIIEFGLQVIFIHFGYIAFHCSMNGLTGHQWGICIGFALITYPLNFILKLLPLEHCIEAIFRLFSCKSKSNKVGDSGTVEEDKQNNSVDMHKLAPDNNEINQNLNSIEQPLDGKRQDSKKGNSKNVNQMLRNNSRNLNSRQNSSKMRGNKKD